MSRLFFCTLLLCIVFGDIYAVRVQFYQNGNFTGLLYESSSTANCTNLPRNTTIQASSLKTNTCLWAYNYQNCRSNDWKRKYSQDTSGLNYHYGSFHVCNETKIEPQLNIDITKHYTRTTVDLPVLHRYNDVCSCVNIPKDVQELDKWSINSNGNDFVGYFEQDCTERKWKGNYFEANSWKSVDMHEHFKMDQNIKYKIRSFGPIPNATYFKPHCMYSLIMQLEKLEINSSHPILSGKPLHQIETYQTLNRIVFFSETNFRGVHLDITTTTGCHNIAENLNSTEVNCDFGSIKTYSCIMIYANKNCSGRSMKFPPGEITNLRNMWENTLTGPKTISSLYNKFPNWKWNTKSFEICNEGTGANGLNVDITEYYPDYVTFAKPVVYSSFKNVCYCQNIPYNVQILEKWSIDNHENSLIAYFEHDCQSSPLLPLWIPAGRSSYSMGFGEFTKLDGSTGVSQKIQSFGPDLDAEYYKINCVTGSGLTFIATVGNVIKAPVVSSFDTRLETIEIAVENQTKSIVEKFNHLEQKLQITQSSLDSRLDTMETLIQNLTNFFDDIRGKDQEQQNKHINDLKSLTNKITELKKHENEYHDLFSKVQELEEKAHQSERKLDNCEKRTDDNFEKNKVEIEELNKKLNDVIHDFA